MNINIDTLDMSSKDREKVSVNYNNSIGKETVARSDKARSNDGIVFHSLGTMMDNTAYGGHGRTKETLMQEMGNQDISNNRNYMVIMSNTVSKEDFAKLQEDGFHPGSTEIETVVTIVDHIKAAMVQGGTEVAGYTDDLDTQKVEKMTGSKVLAEEICKQFEKHDIPVTEENVKAAKKAWEEAKNITELSDGAIKFMIHNKLEPTIDHLYLAEFSGASDGGKQGKGYFYDGTTGYFAKKAEDFNWDALTPQVEKVIEDAGYSVSEETISDGKWLIEKGIPLTEEAFAALEELKEIELPQTQEQIISAIAAAIADGKKAINANMADGNSYLEKAYTYVEQFASVLAESVNEVTAKNKTLSLKNLLVENNNRKSSEIKTEGESPESITGRRQLEEVRLKMSVEANLKLLRSGISIETAPLIELVEQLKEAEKAIQMQLVGTEDSQKAELGFALYYETVKKVDEISGMPLELVGKMAMSDTEDVTTLNKIHQSGKQLQRNYEKLEQTYEAIMTAPRRDMGDSMQKAFRNIEDILQDMDLEPTDENQRAIRILSYNTMELTQENIQTVKEKDSLVTGIIEQMKPGSVLQMIREGKNPLEMTLDELQTYLSEKEETVVESMEDYSKFLYKLEQKGSISEEERSSYIGVYRLLRQIEKGDNAAVGALIQTGEEFSLENLLKAVRSNKKRGMDFKVNDHFDGISSLQPEENSITNQIQKAFSVGKEELQEIIQSLDSETADEVYLKEQTEEIRSIVNTEDAVIKMLDSYHQPMTINNILAAGQTAKYPGFIYKRALEFAKMVGKEEVLEKGIENFQENFTDAEHAKEANTGLQETITNILEESSYQARIGTLDVKELSMMCKQVSLAVSLSKEEQYEVPVTIDGELTSINLRIIHDNNDSGKVTATTWTEKFGKVACEFRITEGVLSGYVAGNGKDGLMQLQDSKDRLSELLAEVKIETGDINFIQSKNLNLQTFAQASESGIQKDRIESEGTEDDASNKTSTQKLYLAAKAFIQYLQE